MNPAQIVKVHIEQQLAGHYKMQAVSLGGHVASVDLRYLTAAILAQAYAECSAALMHRYTSEAKPA